MSKVKRTIEIDPPSIQGTAERLVSVGHCCAYCHGQGWLWSEDEDGENMKRPCPVCQGHTEMDAVIDIRWQPSVHDHREGWMKQGNDNDKDDGTPPRTISFAR